MPGNVIHPEDIFFQGGLITVLNGSDVVTGALNPGNGTSPVFTTFALPGDTIAIGSTRHFIKEVNSDTELILTEPWSGADATLSAYTGRNEPWHLADRSLGYKFSRFLESDVLTSTTAVLARDEAVAARGDAVAARDLAEGWAIRPQGQDVSTPGTRSSLHFSALSSTSAIASEAARAATVALRDAAAISATLAQDWASKPINTDVAGVGTRSALHHAAAAAASAVTAGTAKDNAETASGIAVDKAADAEDAADAAALDALATAADRVQTGLDRVQTNADRVQTVNDRAQTGLDRVATAADRVQTAADRVQTGLDSAAAAAAAVSTAADRVQTGLDLIASASAAGTAVAATLLLENPDYGSFSDAPTIFADYGDFHS